MDASHGSLCVFRAQPSSGMLTITGFRAPMFAYVRAVYGTATFTRGLPAGGRGQLDASARPSSLLQAGNETCGVGLQQLALVLGRREGRMTSRIVSRETARRALMVDCGWSSCLLHGSALRSWMAESPSAEAKVRMPVETNDGAGLHLSDGTRLPDPG